MRIENIRSTERFGSARINDVQKVLELDSGRTEVPPVGAPTVMKIDDEVIRSIEEQMAIVIPARDEKLQLFEGVISGVPHDCTLIVVSNSSRKKVDRFRMEKDTLEQFCQQAQRSAYIIHQKDTAIAQIAQEAGYTDLIGEDGLVRNGKSEGMIIALLMAMALGKKYIGFIDADNYFPGAVLEYAKSYAAGFSMSTSPYTMVRILWRYKPKFAGGLYFKKWGRVSETTNKCLNALLSAATGFETDIIKTGNAGEHAMTIKLAEILPYASGYAVEPQEIISILEQSGAVLPAPYPTVAKHGIDIFQIQTRNPHLHEEKGLEHLRDMLRGGLSAIHYSQLANPTIKDMIITELTAQEALKPDETLLPPHITRPPKKVDLKSAQTLLQQRIEDYFVSPNPSKPTLPKLPTAVGTR